MKIDILKDLDLKKRVDLLAVTVGEQDITKNRLVTELDKILEGTLKKLIEEEDFKGKAGQSLVFHTMSKTGASRLCFLGLGPLSPRRC